MQKRWSRKRIGRENAFLKRWRWHKNLCLALLLLPVLLVNLPVSATEPGSGEAVISTGGSDGQSSEGNSGGQSSEGGSGGQSSEGGSDGQSSEGNSGGQGNKTSGQRIDTTALEQRRKDLLNKIDSIKDSIDSVKDRISELERSKSNLQSYINKLDAEAKSLAAEIKKVEEEISQKQEDIEETTRELDEAQATADQQYENMKIRIQYMYENGNISYLETILTSKSISEMLNRVDYISQINQYDRNMLAE